MSVKKNPLAGTCIHVDPKEFKPHKKLTKVAAGDLLQQVMYDYYAFQKLGNESQVAFAAYFEAKTACDNAMNKWEDLRQEVTKFEQKLGKSKMAVIRAMTRREA